MPARQCRGALCKEVVCVKCLSSAVASVRPSRTGSQRCLERPRKTKGLKLGVWGWVIEGGMPCPGDAESNQQDLVIQKRPVRPKESVLHCNRK